MSGSLVLEEYDTDEYQPTERGECHSYSCALSFLYSRISVALTSLSLLYKPKDETKLTNIDQNLTKLLPNVEKGLPYKLLELQETITIKTSR